VGYMWDRCVLLKHLLSLLLGYLFMFSLLIATVAKHLSRLPGKLRLCLDSAFTDTALSTVEFAGDF